MSTQPRVPTRQPVFFIPHGAGPCFFMDWSPRNTWDGMADFLRSVIGRLPEKPTAILLVSAHWRTQEFSVTAGSQPDLIYDYFGFPDHTYKLTYPAPGAPALAHRVSRLLVGAQQNTLEDSGRGFDHGMFVPLTIMYPEADIPCIQVSLTADLNAAKHIALGRALRHILDANYNDKHVLVLGSGSSFHNMRGFFDSSASANKKAGDFNQWLQDTMQSSVISEIERGQTLSDWKNAPHGIFAHPREEHLLPLHVCYGVNERKADKAISLTLLTKPASMFLWQN